MSELVIIGAGGFGRETAALVEDINRFSRTWTIAGFVDDDHSLKGTDMLGYPVLGDLQWLIENQRPVYFTVPIANARVRRRIADQLEAAGFPAATLTHPHAAVHGSTTVRHGCIICRGTAVTVDAHIEEHTIINLNCTIGHDVQFGKFATLYPGVHVSGGARIGTCVELGTGAVILPNVSVGSETIVGAGAVVNRDLPAGCTAVGVPARPIKTR